MLADELGVLQPARYKLMDYVREYECYPAERWAARTYIARVLGGLLPRLSTAITIDTMLT